MSQSSFAHYRILGELGKGGMGTVYRALDTNLGRQVALKFPNTGKASPDLTARLRREAQAASRLHHPHIAMIHAYGETPDGDPFIDMELVEGEDLAAVCRQPDVSLCRRIEMIEAIAGALGEAHRQNIVHRDIKPSNVKVDGRGTVKVLDFGLARVLHESAPAPGSADSTLILAPSEHGAVMGTPQYMSPEQVRGEELDARSDLFSLGVLLYECVAGRPPFEGHSSAEVMSQVLRDDPYAPSRYSPAIPRALDRVVFKALSKNRDSRHQSAEAMLADLQAVRTALEHAGPAKPRSGSFQAARTATTITMQAIERRPRTTAAIISAVLVFGATWVAWRGLDGTYRPPPEAERLYARGTEALRDDTALTASKILTQAVAVDKDFALAHARLAEAWAELEHVDLAKSEMLTASSLASINKLAKSDAAYLEAIRMMVNQDFPAAVKLYRAIAQHAAPEDKAAAYFDLGRAYEKNNQLSDAMESSRHAIALNGRYAAPHLDLGSLYKRKEDVQRAKLEFQQAQDLYQTVNNFEGVTHAIYLRGVLLNRQGSYDESRVLLERALQMAEDSRNHYQQILALLQLGTLSTNTARLADADKYATKALEVAQANSVENLITRALLQLVNVLFVRNKLTDAEDRARQALRFAQAYKAKYSEAQARFMLASVDIRRGNTDTALDELNLALPIYQAGNYRKGIEQVETLKARVLRDQGKLDESVAAFQRVRSTAEELNDTEEIDLADEGIGSVRLTQERYSEALPYYEATVANRRRSGGMLGAALCGLAKVHAKLGAYDRANALLAEATQLAEKGGPNSAHLAEIDQTKAEMAVSQFHPAAARRFATRGLTEIDRDDKEGAINLHRVIGVADIALGNRTEGLSQCIDAEKLAASLRRPGMLLSARLSLSEALLETQKYADALKLALEIATRYKASGQEDSEWRASLFAARAYFAMGYRTEARQWAGRAERLLADFRQRESAMDNNSFSARPDVRHCENLIRRLAAN